jgi:ABC-type transport system substrate-binding protein
MRSTRTKIERTALVLLLAVGTACSAKLKPPIGHDRDIPPVHGGVLHTAFFTDVRSLDAATAFDTGSAAIEQLIYDTLVSYDEKGKLIPQLAQTIDVSPDGKRYTFTLHRGVLMQDGNELKASDVKRSIERALDPNTPCPVPSFYDRILGYKAFHDGKAKDLTGVQVEGDYVVSIRLSEPDATFLPKMALPIVAPVCRSAGRTWDRDFSTHACGAGPFRLVHFEGGQVIRLKRFQGYWQKGLPYLDGIVWYLGMQPYTQRFKFEDGAIDYMREFDAADLALYRSDPAWRGHGAWGPGLSTNGTFLNTEMEPFNNVHVRRAVAFATNRAEVCTIRPGVMRPQYKMVPDEIIPDTPGYPGQHFNYQRALEEMRLAGYPYDPKTGKGGYPKVIPYLAILNGLAQQAAEIFQQQLARIGLRIEIEIVGYPTFLAKTEREKTVPMGFVGWNADFPDPSDFFDPILSSSAIQPEDSQNAAFFSNKELDRLLVKAHRSTDHAARLAMYRRAEQIVADQAPWVVAYSYRYFELWQPYVHGYTPHPVMSQYVRNMWFDVAEKKRALADYGPCWLPGAHQGCAPARGGARTTLALAEERSR